MKRDVIAAVVIGFVLGGIAAVATINLPTLLKPVSKTHEAESINLTVTPQPTIATSETVSSLIISEPSEESIVADKELKIAGKTKTGDAVLVESETDIAAADVKEDGVFSATITLSEGANLITVYGVSDSGEEIKTITVYYTSDKL